jgi:hypothetical protein
VDSDEGEDNEDEDVEEEDENTNQPPLEIPVSLMLFLTSSGGFAVRKLLAVTSPTNRSILCPGLDLRVGACEAYVLAAASPRCFQRVYEILRVCVSWKPS